MRKGQASVEFMFLIGFMFVIFVVFFIVIQERTVEANNAKNRQALKEITHVVKSEIRNAELFKYGYKRTFSIPKLLNGQDYSINISEDGYEVQVNFSGVSYLDFLDNYTYAPTIQPGLNEICKKEYVSVNNCTDI